MNGLDVKEQRRQKLISKIREFRIVDDPFMTKVFENAPECIELLLHIILNQPDLKVQKHSVQEGIKNLQGRSVRLDVYAEDSTGKKYDIEMQLANKGATPRRARYNLSLMDANSLMPGDNTDELPEAYVIFITENDVIGKGRPIYMVDRTIRDDCGLFDDGSHIIYVNGSYREDNSPLTRLVHDLFCPDPNKMNFKQLADRARYFKEDVKGVENMCEVMERFVYEERMEERFEAVRRMIKDGVLSYEKVAEYSGLPVEKVLEIAGKKTA